MLKINCMLKPGYTYCTAKLTGNSCMLNMLNSEWLGKVGASHSSVPRPIWLLVIGEHAIQKDQFEAVICWATLWHVSLRTRTARVWLNERRLVQDYVTFVFFCTVSRLAKLKCMVLKFGSYILQWHDVTIFCYGKTYMLCCAM